MTKTALLTGGSRGIGAATAALLRERGWTIVAPTSRDLDLSRPVTSVLRYLIPAVLDALILCGGEWYSRPLSAQSLSHFNKQFAISVESSYLLIKHALPALKQSGGCVVAVASTRAFIGGVECAPYAVAKAGLVALMQGFAREYGGPVRFNVVAPGLTDTALGAQVRATGGAKHDAEAQPPEAVADEIVRLIESDENGKVMRVVARADGGGSVLTEAKWTW